MNGYSVPDLIVGGLLLALALTNAMLFGNEPRWLQRAVLTGLICCSTLVWMMVRQ